MDSTRRTPAWIFALTEDSAIAYGTLLGQAARSGRPMSALDGMIAAIAQDQGCPLATRNSSDFQGTGVGLVDPWSG